jgi:uncharacterized glyoxalase superfamily protein PhnB
MSAARISIVTLGVDDLERALTFYQTLGWVNSAASQATVKFLQGNNIVLGLYGRAELAEDANADIGPAGFSGISLAVNLASEDEVDAFYKRAMVAGARGQKPPKKAFWGGYSGYFCDPDGHYWEVAHNPFFEFDKDGNLALGAAPQTDAGAN